METVTETGGTPVFRTGCCEPFDPEPWRDTLVRWDDKPFIRKTVRAVMHVPIGVGTAVLKATEDIRAAGVLAPNMTMLADGASPWRTVLRFETTGPVPGYPFEKISGTFYSKVFDGPWRDAAKWHAKVRQDAEARGFEIDAVYEMWTTCPACAKAYGHNWVVLLAKTHEHVTRAAPKRTAA